MSESKVVQLDSVLKMLEDEAKEAHRKASECIGIDNDADCYYQGLRNGYLKAAELLKQKSNQLA